MKLRRIPHRWWHHRKFTCDCGARLVFEPGDKVKKIGPHTAHLGDASFSVEDTHYEYRCPVCHKKRTVKKKDLTKISKKISAHQRRSAVQKKPPMKILQYAPPILAPSPLHLRRLQDHLRAGARRRDPVDHHRLGHRGFQNSRSPDLGGVSLPRL